MNSRERFLSRITNNSFIASISLDEDELKNKILKDKILENEL